MSERAKAQSRAAQLEVRPQRQRTLRRALIVLGGIALLGAIVAATLKLRTGATLDVPADAMAPEGQRVRVQVLNASGNRGMARLATRHLRDRGFDVVEMGNASDRLDSTLVLDRSGHPDWTARVANALGGARTEARPDSSRYLDVTVLLGRAWRPPAEAFYP